MKPLFALTVLSSLVAVAGPYKNRIDDALEALADGRSLARKVGGGCRTAVDGNFTSAMKDVEDARDGASERRVQAIQLFVAGMALAGGIAGCPEPVIRAIAEAQDALTRAKGLASERDQRERDRDERERERSRRDRDDDERLYARSDRRRSDDDEEDSRDRRPSRRTEASRSPMSERDFQGLLQAVGAETYGSDRLNVVQSANRASFTAEQVGRLVDVMTYSDEKVKVVELLGNRIVDRQNTFRLYAHFTYSNDKARVQQVLAR